MNKGIPFPKVFEVIDKRTGKVADIQQIIKEEWAQRLNTVDTEVLGFFISEDGTLYLGGGGNLVPCDYKRFKIIFTESWREWWLLGDYQRERYPGEG